jgi:hypothetical protein
MGNQTQNQLIPDQTKLLIYKGLDVKDRVEILSTVSRLIDALSSPGLTENDLKENVRQVINSTHYPDIARACLEAQLMGIQWTS